MNAHVNGNCIGCGLCASVCPGQEEMVREAADGCPVDAIEVD